MLQNKTLDIYPTSRAIRETFYKNLHEDKLLHKTSTIGEFENKAILVPKHTFADDDTKILLMQEASDFANFQALNIDREFFSFLKNAKYLFGFFDELAMEMVSIEKLKEFDIYAHYQEHLEILERLQQSYIQKLSERKLVDKITLPLLYQVNRHYVRSFDTIVLHLEGYLNRFELKLFLEIAQLTTFKISLHTNEFNPKMRHYFQEMGFELQSGYHYLLNLSTLTIEETQKSEHSPTTYEVQAYESKLEQVAFIKKKIYDFIQEGIAPEEIIVLLPTPSVSELLDLFDEENNFNFAMGFSYQKHPLYKKLSALYEYYQENSFENRYRIRALGFEEEQVKELQKEWKEHVDKKAFLEKLDRLVSKEESEAYQIFEKEKLLFIKLLPSLSHYPFHRILHLFLNRLSKKSLDDTRGGKITVLEILETRGIQKEAVIVIDFNEGVLPNISKKDLFLSSALRKACDLPTPIDRQNLQKYYYKRVFEKAKKVAISYLEDEQNQPSRFLEELGLSPYLTPHPDVKSILFAPTSPKPHYQKESLILEYDFRTSPLSATRLKTFLDCKRKFYHKYIQELQEFEIPKEQEDERIIGTLVHKALQNIYRIQKAYYDEETLLLALQKELYLQSQHSLSLRFLIDIWLEKLKPFVRYEIERFQEGFHVISVEKSFQTTYCDIPLTGNIDRIDKKENLYYILDYKTGKIPKTTKKSLPQSSDFQLQFYYLLTQNLGTIANTYYYDLNQSSLIDEPLFDEKLLLLEEYLKEFSKSKTYNFSMTEDLKKCLYCPYQKICNRIL